MSKVSIIVPCYNEEATIHLLLDSIHKQNYPLDEIEVIIADGLSTDHTREVITQYQQKYPELDVHIVDNKNQTIPSGLNRALDAAQGEYIVRLDAHSMPDENYVNICVELLEEGYGDNVGGVWRIEPGSSTWIAKAIAVSASHPFGVGDARYRVGGKAQEVNTVPFGAFHRKLVNKIGPFDETLLSNEDYEFNVRVRQSGGKVWFDPNIQSTYFARSTIKKLAEQYWRYGYWKAQMLKRYPSTIRWRQAIPPIFVCSIFLLGFFTIWYPIAKWILAIELSFYLSILIIAGIQIAVKKHSFSLLLGIPLAIATMHFFWGSALIWGLVKSPTLNLIMDN
jgi:glycosyltransferase involved in cell wall biosynthesis